MDELAICIRCDDQYDNKVEMPKVGLCDNCFLELKDTASPHTINIIEKLVASNMSSVIMGMKK